MSGHLPENITKNRFPDIVPVDTYRAYLSTPVKGSNEYINAVFLPVSEEIQFIATKLRRPGTSNFPSCTKIYIKPRSQVPRL